MNNSYEINKLRVQQFGLTATVKDDDGKEHHFYRGHEYIEIGGLKWAVTNVGAEKETDSGLYFAFGETQGYTAEQVLKGERKFDEYEYTNANFDSVNVYWGEKWRIPIEADFYNLQTTTTHEWVSNYQDSGVNGILFTDITDSSKKLFFPAVGCCFNGSVEYVDDDYGLYWSSSLFADDVDSGVDFIFSRGYSTIVSNKRYVGFSIRGIFT